MLTEGFPEYSEQTIMIVLTFEAPKYRIFIIIKKTAYFKSSY